MMDSERGGYEKLFRAIEGSHRKLRPFKDLNRALVNEYVGPTYGKARTESKQGDKYLNKLNQAVDAYTMLLAANRPKVLINTRYTALKPFARHFQTALNNLIEEIGIEFTIRRWVLDAFFCVGFVKVHLADSGLVQVEVDRWMDPGTPFASNVSIDNIIFDFAATKWSEVAYMGDMYRIPQRVLREGEKSGMYFPGTSEQVLPTSKTRNLSDERVEAISKGWEVDDDEFEPMVDLADIWIPSEGVVHTFGVQDRDAGKLFGKPVATIKWDQSEHGPYHILTFNDVPDNLMPTSPASHLVALDRAINIIMAKETRRAKSAKRNIAYTPGGAADAERIKKAGDLQLIRVDDIQNITTFEQQGVSRESQAFLQALLELFDVQAGNLTALLGLGSQADTAAQERMIHDAGSRKGSQMQYRVMDATRRLLRDLGFMLWEDKFKTIAAQDAIGGDPNLAYDATWTPDNREGNFLDYNIDISVYSMAYQSPSQRAQALTALVNQVYLPGMQMLQAQGGIIDYAALTDMYAELMDLPRLKEIVRFQARGIEEVPQGDLGQNPQKPQNTTRNYVRRNVPTGGTPQSRSHVMQQQWLGGGNPDQVASLKRPVA